MLRGNAQRLKRLHVKVDLDLSDLAAVYFHRGHARHALERPLNLLLDKGAQLDRREPARGIGHAEEHDGVVGRVEAPDQRLLDAVRKLVAQETDLSRTSWLTLSTDTSKSN
jgi:hypothetical protein